MNGAVEQGSDNHSDWFLPLPQLLAEPLETLVPQLHPSGITQLLPLASILGIDPDELHAALAVRMCRCIVRHRVFATQVDAILARLASDQDYGARESFAAIAAVVADTPGIAAESIGFEDVQQVLGGI